MDVQPSTFTFGIPSVDPYCDTIVFPYSLIHGEETFSFQERLAVPGISKNENPSLVKRILEALHLILGISYWKTFCPVLIDTASIALTKDQAEFWNTVYTKGLGEFFYRNSIDFRRLIQFPASKRHASDPVPCITQDKSLVGLGGGKDSVVSTELLLSAGKDFALFSLDGQDVHRSVAHIIGKPLIEVTRTIDRGLYALNERKDVYNGHIPVSAVYAFVGLLLGVLGGYRYVIASNEESADYPNVEYLGGSINHQWSKTLEFEMLFQDYVSTYITADSTYFSLLRPVKEITVLQRFAGFRQYFSAFSSCNANFRRSGEAPSERWCGTCPKCAFLFLLLSAFVSKKELLTIMGRNLYASQDLLPAFRELLGIAGVKPFACVGTPEECRFALWKAYGSGQYSSDICMRTLRLELDTLWNTFPELEDSLFSQSLRHRIPPSFQSILSNI